MALMNWRTDDVGLFDVNFDTGERYWSGELRQLLGIPLDVPAAFDLLLRLVHPEDRRAFAMHAMEVFRPDCPAHAAGEFRIVARDGAVHWVHAERVTIFRPTAEHDVVRIAGFMAEIAEPDRPFGTVWTVTAPAFRTRQVAPPKDWDYRPSRRTRHLTNASLLAHDRIR